MLESDLKKGMIKLKRSWLNGILAGALLISVLSACSKSESTKGADPGSASENGTKAEEKMKLTFWNLDDATTTNSPIVEKLKQEYNIDIDFISSSRDAMKEKLNLMIASNEIPDWWKEPNFPDYDKLIEQGVATEIPQNLIEQYMPKYVAWLKRYLGDDPFKYVRREDKIYGLPVIWDIGIDGIQLAFRSDWMKKVGIAKTPETLEEMETALTKFRNDDPDGNGKKDTYGITASADNVEAMFSSVFGAFDAYPNIFRQKDGKIVRGEIEPGAKEALTVLNRWYKNELIDPEFVVNKGSNVEDKVLADKIGAIEFYWWSFLPGNAFLGGEQWYDKLKKKHPEFNFETVGGVKGPNGSYGISQYNPAYASGIMFGKQLAQDQNKLIKYMQVFEATEFDPAKYELMNFGVEGQHWKKSDKGTIEFIPPYDDEKVRKKAGIGGFSLPGSFNDYNFQTAYTSDQDLRNLAQDTRAKGTQVIDILSPFNKPVYNDYQDKLKQFTLTTYIDFITGRKSLDEFDKFVAEWKKMGGDKVLEEAQKIYDENLK
ncbi:hypothetical protein BK138_10415 [Paenibacillus rhizosphaerae]|uniref:ABC transporter substrate-binding protein n=1 Tax=Paenibacillus rhizosphaerae TaxID=297318 RepID=A0A1R1F434_9BACL|nr:extracellular solute-binding protein [Paenibacillus rhizosphaerae]OMF58868.1 hypothetical protein BK138_10415 [Paenibacillus rhizosphaerae]